MSQDERKDGSGGMNHPELGELEPVDVRTVWSHEALDFTPWLSENLQRLSDELGIELELEAREVQVGPYRADMVARTPQSGECVLIENQLGEADFHHLGQIMAYMAGLEAKIVVWVATKFNDTLRSAIRWLNEHTTDRFAFFAVRVSVVRIGDSPNAPVFRVVEGPNERDRQVRDASRQGSGSELGQFRRDFWTHFAERRPDAPGLKPGYAGSNVWSPIEGTGLRVVQFLAQDSVGVYLAGNHGEEPEDYLPKIEPHVEALRRALGDDGLVAAGSFPCITTFRVDARDRSNWNRMADWLDDRRRTCEQVLQAGAPR